MFYKTQKKSNYLPNLLFPFFLLGQGLKENCTNHRLLPKLRGLDKDLWPLKSSGPRCI